MKSFLRISSNTTDSSKKRLALTLLVSFCLAYMGQAFAMPMMCMMPANEMAASSVDELSAIPPCHQMMSEAVDCCEHMDSASDSDLTMTSSDCACPDGGCGASLMLVIGFSCAAFNISEQPNYYSAIGFPNQIDSALFRPPIA